MVLACTLSLTAAILIGSFFYYGAINDAEDPRLTQARNYLHQYEKEVPSDQPGLALSLLDSMEMVYASTPGYAHSYETGVLLNNKASVHLVQLETELLTTGEIDKEAMATTLATAKELTIKAIGVYERWLEHYGTLTPEQIRDKIKPFFDPAEPALEDRNVERILSKRIDDIVLAQQETVRRMSVSYTNLGVINRYQGNLEKAKHNYEKAIGLWYKNYTARDNLNVLMDLPVQKRSIISQLFPPDREEKLP